MVSRTAILFVLFGFTGCVSQEVRIVDMTPPEQLERLQTENELLDIGIAVFDTNIPEDYDEQQERLIQPEVRRAEANYFPYFAKNMLQSTGNWGAVRVVPRPTDAVDVIVTGKILHSDGESMSLEAEAHDASGHKWFTNTYHTLASKYAYEDTMPRSIDPFQAIYRQLANDLLEYRKTLSTEEVQRIRTTAELKFAGDFAPDAFAGHLRERENGEYDLVRLPSQQDPMLTRVRKVREREYLFIDTLDEYYANFHRKMYEPYQQWRHATYDEAIAYKELRAEARARTIGGAVAIVGGVAAIYESGDAYVDAGGVVTVMGGALTIKSAIAKRAEAEFHADSLREMGTALDAEVTPYTMELENQTIRLQGTVDEQYQELRRILRKVYFEDLGLTPPPLATEEATLNEAPETAHDS